MSEKEDEDGKSSEVLSLTQGYKCIFVTNGILNWGCFFDKKKLASQPVMKFLAFYGTRRFTTVSTRARHWTSS
jgi:hypothetical protein